MSARLAALALACAVLAGSVALARAQGPPVAGGTVPSMLGLSLSEPSPFTRTGSADGQPVYTATVGAEATATDAPIRLGVSDGEVTVGPRLGHLVGGSSILPTPLQAAADGGAYRSLDALAASPLQRWSEPVAQAATTIRLRQIAPNSRALHNHHKLLLVTLSAGGP